MLAETFPTVPNICAELAIWGAHGSPVPPPSIIKQISLASYVRGSQYRRFVETGTYLGHTTFLIASLGVDIDTIELSDSLHGHNVKDFAGRSNIRCHQGDSTHVLPRILATLDTPAVFWLDGHYSAGNTALGDKVTPIAEELELLRNHHIKTHIVIIDDMRGFGQNGYPTVEWVKEIGLQIVPGAEPRLMNDSLILATPDQHAAAEAVRSDIARHFILEDLKPNIAS